MAIIGGINLGNLPNYLLFFADGSVDANWQGATKGFAGDVAVNGIAASERTSGSVPYAGTISTNDTTLSAWQNIITQNLGQASSATGQTSLIAGLQTNLVSAIQQINALSPTSGFSSVSATSLNGLNTQNGISEIFVINVTSGFSNISSEIKITGDAGDIFILRWDTDGNPSNGYQGQVKFQSGGAIVPLGGLKASNFINVAGDIDSSGGGSNPAPPYPQGPRLNDGQGSLIAGGSDFNGGGFFTGYWLTTGAPTTFNPSTGLYTGATHSLSNGIFVGGWYSLTNQFSMTSGTSGVYVSPNIVPAPGITVQKLVSPDGGVTFVDADTPPGPNIPQGTNPIFKYIVTNTGNVTLTNITLTDNILGPITIPTTSLVPRGTFTVNVTGTWLSGQRNNVATVTGQNGTTTVRDTNPANYVGISSIPAISVRKLVSPDGGLTFVDADTPPGPNIPQGTNPIFRYIVANNGSVTLSNITLTDSILGPITIPTTTLASAGTFTVDVTGTWASGQRTNLATVTGQNGSTTVNDTNPANYVGVAATPAITVQKFVSPDGGITFVDADTPPGPNIPQGTNPIFKYIVTNTGNVTLSSVSLTDSILGSITIPTTTLVPGQSFTINSTGTWGTGLMTNVATATGQHGTTTVNDTNPANYTGVAATPAITVQKLVSPDGGITFVDADTPPGPNISQDTNPIFRYIVTNTGNVTLTNIALTDSVLGSILIPLTILAPGGTFTVDTTETWASGLRTNVATITGQYGNTTVSGTNPANYTGIPVAPAITVQKLVSPDGGVTFFSADTPPGPSIPAGTSPIFRYIVTNTGNVTLTNVTLSDSILGTIVVPTTTLVPGGTFTVDITGTWVEGQNVNITTTTGKHGTTTVSDTNPAYYLGIAIPAIDVLKLVSPDGGITFVDADTPPGPSIPAGTNPIFRYIVKNTGNVTLTSIALTDTVLGPITMPTMTLVAGGTFTVDKTGTWTAGQNENVATVTGQYKTTTVTASNPANYFGVATPVINVEKLVSPDGGITFVTADTPPGPSIPSNINPIFRFIVTNNGNVTLTNITLLDTVLGSIVIPTTTLNPGQSFTVNRTGTWTAGQNENVATVTGQYGTTTVNASDPAHYVGIAVPAINVKKLVSPNGGITFVDADTPPGPNIQQGTDPIFRYIVTNIGNVTLTNVSLTDSILGTIAVPTTTLTAGGTFTVNVTGNWAAGQNGNVATVTGQYGNTTVSDENPANYFGVAALPAINVEKLVSPDGGITFIAADTPPGPSIPAGTNPIFRYIVTNIGNVMLSNVTLTDSVLGPIVIPTTTMNPGQSFTVNKTGTWNEGQNVNVAIATGQYGTRTVSDTNPANYFGVATPAINVTKLVSPDGGITFVDANTPPGPNIPQGTNPVFRYIVTNTGNVTLTNVTLTDSVLGTITIPATTLNPGGTFTVNVTGTWAAGQRVNVATVTGQYGNTTISDEDQANYFGVAALPVIDVEKLVSPDGGITFIDADTPPGPNILQGTNPIFRYIVKNTGNVMLTNVTLTDSILGLITIPTTTMAPGETFTVNKAGTWAAGQNVNVATVTGKYGNTTVNDTDPAYYVGVGIVKLILEKSATPDRVIKGDIITYTVKITNTGAIPLNNVIFKDPIPDGTSFIENSFAIDSVTVPGANPEAGVNLGTIIPGQSITVSFLVKFEYRPCSPIIKNTAFAKFDFKLVPSGPVEIGVAESNTTETETASTNFKQLSVDENLTIPHQKPDAEDIQNTIVGVDVIETRVIKTMVGTSEEGQVLTGYKLIIEGILHQKVEYVADEPTQTVHTAEFDMPFSSFIILPKNFVEGSIINAVAYVEDVYVKLLDKRHIFKNVTLRLEADITC